MSCLLDTHIFLLRVQEMRQNLKQLTKNKKQ